MPPMKHNGKLGVFYNENILILVTIDILSSYALPPLTSY